MVQETKKQKGKVNKQPQDVENKLLRPLEFQDEPDHCGFDPEMEIGLEAIDHIFKYTPPVAPANGFVERWQVRLCFREIQRHRRQIAGLFLVLGIGMLGSLGLFLGLVIKEFRWISIYLQETLYGFAWFDTVAEETLKGLYPIFRIIPGLLMVPIWFIIGGLIWGGGVFWIMNKRKSIFGLPGKKQSIA